MPQPYDHAFKIGNEGDLFKHTVLVRLVALVAARSGREAPFVYAETNAGRPRYVLPADGEWARGVGAFAKNAASKGVEENETKVEKLREYRALCIGHTLEIGSTYPGSAEIAFRLLRARHIKFEMHLWEKLPSAFDDLTRHFYPWHQSTNARVVLAEADGYEGITALLTDRTPRFVLVDPPNADDNAAIERLLGTLLEKNVDFLCWTPKSGKAPTEKGRPATQPRPHFEDLLRSGSAAAVFARWTKWARSGACQLTVPTTLLVETEAVAKRVCETMSPEWAVVRP